MDTHHVDDVNSFQGVPQDSKSREMIDKEKKAELNSSIFGEIMSYFIISWGFETAEDGKVFTSSFKACKKEFHWRPVLFLESDIWSERLLGDEGIKRCPIKTQKNVKKSSEGVDEKPLDVGEVNPPSMHAWQYWSLDHNSKKPGPGLLLVAKSCINGVPRYNNCLVFASENFRTWLFFSLILSSFCFFCYLRVNFLILEKGSTCNTLLIIIGSASNNT